MGADSETLDYYTDNADAYAQRALQHVGEAPLAEFASRVPNGGAILDLGCGSGWAAAHFRNAGFAVTAIDGSQGLADAAAARHGLTVTVATFESLDADAEYDGIWASFCLLHDSRDAMPRHLFRLHRALRPGGHLYIGLKEGTGQNRDRFGRMYTYFGQDEMTANLLAAGFMDPEITAFQSPGMAGVEEPCLHIFARRD